jgi:pimeloyl-ACP methyl ester carboxylesterase
MFTRKTSVIGKQDAVFELKSITLGGIPQWISVRGENKKLPVLLFLHGGPGTGQIGFMSDYQRELEKHFIVVNWDQRGAGLSYNKLIPKESMTVSRILADTIELTEYLRNQFQIDKIYLIGHSWGTILGLLAVKKHPEYFHRYIGVSQVINISKAEELSYKMVLEKAIEANDPKAVSLLTEIGKPPWKNLKHDRIHQKYTEAFGGGISHDGKLVNTFIKKLLKSQEYTWFDIIRFIKGQFFSINHLLSEMRKLDLSETINQVEVPITVIAGRYDLTNPSEPAKIWFDKLQAKEKTWIWYEESAHSPLFEENQIFIQYVINQKNTK